jgi:S-adenosyl-L-methionine hydrolase (adenosine-forming)
MPLLTLTSDFGLQDHISASVKGQFFQHVNDLQAIVDISHALSPFNLQQTAYVLKSTLSHFPENTYHCIFVNLFETLERELLCFQYNNQYIFCANNGLLNLIVADESIAVYAIPLDKQLPLTVINYVQTMAKGINWIAGGGTLENLGERKQNVLMKNNLKPLEGEDWIEGYIIFIDQYENVIVNITQQQFEKARKNRKFKIVFKRDEIIEKISETYSNVSQGEKLALFNTAGYLEIAVNQGNAAGLFGFRNYGQNANNAYAQKNLYYQTIKIFFE